MQRVNVCKTYIPGIHSMDNSNQHIPPQTTETTKPSSPYVGVPLETLDKSTGVLRVYFLVLDGLAMTATSCPKNFQPQTLEVLFDLLREASKVPGMNSDFFQSFKKIIDKRRYYERRGILMTNSNLSL